MPLSKIVVKIEYTTQNKRPFFCPKKKLTISEPNFIVRFGQFFLKMIATTSRKTCCQKKVIFCQKDLFRKIVENAK